MATTTTRLTPACIINVLCQKWRLLGGSADEMCCTGKEVAVDAYQPIDISLWWICEVSVRVALGVFLSLKLKWWLLSTIKNAMDSMSGGEDRGDDGLGIRKY